MPQGLKLAPLGIFSNVENVVSAKTHNLTTLGDGRKCLDIPANVAFATGDIMYKSQTFTGYASTNSLDRQQEIVEPEAFRQDLPEYLTNPLVTFQHNMYYPIGKALSVEIDATGLKVTDELLDMPNDSLISYVTGAIAQRVLRTMSIGFFPLEWQDENENGEILATNSDSWRMHDDAILRRYTRVKLVEHAVVSYPANQNAFIDAMPMEEPPEEPIEEPTEEEPLEEVQDSGLCGALNALEAAIRGGKQ